MSEANDCGVCAGCGAIYPTEVNDLFTRPGTVDEYCQECASIYMLAESDMCDHCKLWGVALCEKCKSGGKVASCSYCQDTGVMKTGDGDATCMMCSKAKKVKLFTTKEGLGAVRE